MIRWGSTPFGVIFIVLIIFTWFIKYPDTIIGDFTLSTSNPPIQIINRLDGSIKTIHFQEGEYVKKGEKIVAIENVLAPNGVLFLSQFLTDVKTSLSNKHFEFQNLTSNNSLGEIQTAYNELLNNLKDFNSLMNNQYYLIEANALQNKIEQNKQLILNTRNKVDISKESLEIAKERFQINQQLYQSKVLTKMEFLDNKEKLNSNKKAFEDINTLLIERKIALDGLQNQYDKLVFDRQEQKRKTRESIENKIRTIENHVAIWSKGNILKAPFDGVVSYSKPLYPNMFVPSNEPLFIIIPQSEDYKGYISVSHKGMGKIKVGNKVFIRFHNYPHKEFGQVVGVIDYIPNIAFNNSFNISVKLSDGLTTTYNRKIVFTPEMQGEAEIITKDIRLAERFVYHIYSALD